MIEVRPGLSARASNLRGFQLGGETYGAMRTGRAIDALSGMALDPRVQEIHEITEAYLPAMNAAILATYKGFWPNKRFSMYCGQANNRRLVDFTPSEHEHGSLAGKSVAGAMEAGTALAKVQRLAAACGLAGLASAVMVLMMQLTQVLGSLYGAKAIARRTFQEQHPMIGNADAEASQIREEEMEEAALQSIQQQLLAGTLPLPVAGMIRKHLAAGDDVFTAIDKTDKELRATQATEAPPAPEGMMAPPEAMPGLSGGPAADQQQMAPQVEVPGDVSRMRQLIQTMGG